MTQILVDIKDSAGQNLKGYLRVTEAYTYPTNSNGAFKVPDTKTFPTNNGAFEIPLLAEKVYTFEVVRNYPPKVISSFKAKVPTSALVVALASLTPATLTEVANAQNIALLVSHLRTDGIFLNGTEGVKGIQGIQGIKGDKGDKGDIGSTGSQGLKGDQGIQGTVGSIGATGAKGDQGIQGTVGSMGATGAKGDQGIQGTVGSMGATGSTGSQGIKGDIGNTGTQGIQGATGIQGIQGTSGTTALTTKGDLIAHDGTSPIRIPLGAANTYLVADSTVASGLKWVAIPVPTTTIGQITGLQGALNTKAPLASPLFTGSLYLSAAGSSEASPKVFGFAGDGSLVYTRFEQDGSASCWQGGSGRRQQFVSYHGIELYGGRTGTDVPFVGGTGTGDDCVSIITNAGTKALSVKTSAGAYKFFVDSNGVPRPGATPNDRYALISEMPTGGGGSANSPTYQSYFDDYMSPAVSNWAFTSSSNTGGSVAQMPVENATTDSCGAMRMSTGTDSTGRSSIFTQQGLHLGTTQDTDMTMRVRVNQLSTGTDSASFRNGLMDSIAGMPGNGLYFSYDTTLSANWQLIQRINSVSTSTDTGIAVVDNTWYKLRIFIDSEGVVTASIDGTNVETPAGMLIAGAGKYLMASVQLKNLGTVAHTADVDYFQLSLTWKISR